MRNARLFAGLLLVVGVTTLYPEASVAASRRGAARGKAKTNVPAQKEKGAEISHVRFWRINEGPDGPVPLVRAGRMTAGDASFKTIPLQPGGYETGSYTDVPAGLTLIELAAASDPAFSAPVRATAFLGPRGATTVLIRQWVGGGLSAEIIDDSVVEAGDVTIYNFLPGSVGPAQVSVGDAASARLEAGKGSFRVRGLAQQLYPVSISVGEGRRLHWNSEIDFRSYRRASLVVFLDVYGRIRGRVFPDEATGFAASAR